MEVNYPLLLAIFNDECFANNPKKYGYSSMDELKEQSRHLGNIDYVRSNNQTSVRGITFGSPGESLDVSITSDGKKALREKIL